MHDAHRAGHRDEAVGVLVRVVVPWHELDGALEPVERAAHAHRGAHVGRLDEEGEAEIRREIATRDGGKASEDSASPGTDGDKLGGTPKKRTVGGDLQQRATAPPKQDRRWPTTVDHHAGPTGPAGPGTAGERKGSVIDASGPQQGVIRNRW